MLVDTSVAVDVVQTKRQLQLVGWFAALRHANRLETTSE